MPAKKKKTAKVPKLTLHTLIGAMSYWGSATRLALISFLALIVFIVQVVNAQSDPINMSLLSAIITQGQLLVYVIVSFLLLDVGYVTIAKQYTFSNLFDRLALIGAEIVLGLGYFLPYFAVVSERVIYLTRHVFVAVLFILAVRIVLGMLYGTSKR